MPLFDPVECSFCNKAFIPRRPWQQYCCPEHRAQAYYKRQVNSEKSDDWWDRPRAKPITHIPRLPSDFERMVEERRMAIQDQAKDHLAQSLEDLGYTTKKEESK
jgi:hypothetical protein